MKSDHETLGNNVVPSNYSILLRPSLKTFKFEGVVVMSAKVAQSTKSIKLNAQGLKIPKASVWTGKVENKASVKQIGKEGIIELKIAKPVSGDVRVEVHFSGVAGDDLSGMYRSRYELKGKTRYLLTTHFEPVSARKMLPCIDEPEFKATFDVTLEVDGKLECVSNMPVKSSKKIGSKRRVVFETTPRMSTYLLYIGVGEYERTSGMHREVKVSLLAPPGKKGLMQMPLDYSIKFLKFFEDYYDVKYPLKKLDLIAMPDFPVGAMENWGAITSREADILGNEATAVSIKQRIAQITSHEIAHQWFGDLVTMRWWNDLWLNESFANFMEEKAMDALFPEWNIHTHNVAGAKVLAYTMDQSRFTHPVSAHVERPGQIEAIFDRAISYEKGGIVIEMMEDYVGEEAFRKGLHNYLSEHKYGNTVEADLWGAIAAAAKKSGGDSKALEVATAWTNKPGYPIIEITRKGDSVELSQRRFYMLQQAGDKDDTWPIPISYITSTGEAGKFLMDKKRHALKLNGAEWVKLNYGQKALYRVAYPTDMLVELERAVSEGKLTGVDAWGIENDLFTMVRTGRIEMGQYLSFVENCCFGSGYPLNISVLRNLDWLFTILYRYDDSRVSDLLARYAAEVLRRVTWEQKPGESSTDKELRSAAISALGLVGDGDVVKKAREMFELTKKNPDGVDPNIRGAIYGINMWNGDAATFEALKGMYLKASLPEEKRRLLLSLGDANDETVSKALEFALTKDVRGQDLVFFPRVAGGGPVDKRTLWDWTKGNWKMFMKRFAPGDSMLDDLVESFRLVADKKLRNEIASFFKQKASMREDVERPVRQTLEAIDANIKFLEANDIM